MRTSEGKIIIIIIGFIVMSFYLSSMVPIAKAIEQGRKNILRERSKKSFDQEITKIIEKPFAKNETIDARELRNTEWKLKAIGIPAIPILLDYISLANSKDDNERIKGEIAIEVLVKIGDPVLPYLNKQPYCSYLFTQKVEKEIKEISGFKKVPPSPKLDEEIKGLVKKISLHDSDYNDSGGVKERKREESNYAIRALTAIGTPAIPYLLPLINKVYLSDMGGNATGWNVVRILVEIGDPSLPYLESLQYSKSEIAQEIIRGIKEKKRVIEEIEHLKKSPGSSPGSDPK